MSARALDGLRVLDLSAALPGAVTTMLLADAGAEVVKVEPPGGDPFRHAAGSIVWNRGKQGVVLDLRSPEGVVQLRRLAAEADVLVEGFAPGVTKELGIDEPTLRSANEQLVYCSITGYGRSGRHSERPGYDALVQARLGLQYEQPGLRSGPVFLHTPLPSYGAALLASIGIRAALIARARIGRGQWVETSLAQGALLWMTQAWKRAERPTPSLFDLWRFTDLPPTPCYEAADGQWFHPMPGAIPVALQHVGRDPGEINRRAMVTGDHDQRAAAFAAARELFRSRPMEEWLALIQSADQPCQPVQPAEKAFEHPQLIHNGAVCTVDIPGVGAVTQFGAAYRVDGEPTALRPTPPPAVGEHTATLLTRGWSSPARFRPAGGRPGAAGAGPLAGLRVLVFGAQLAGPFGPMILSDLGAEVIKVDPAGFLVGQADDSTWVAVQRGKRSIAIDLKRDEGRRLAAELIASADVVHSNLRVGVAERLGFGFEQAKAINPNIVYCQVTGYGSSGPMATLPGVDQMGQALCGLEYEQGATPSGGHPTWYRFGMCDATAAMLSVIGVLDVLLTRRTATRVDADILTGGLFLASDAFQGPPELPRRPHLDVNQTGIDALYRLYETASGWLCLAAARDRDWRPLCEALDLEAFIDDERFRDRAARRRNQEALAHELEAAFRARPVGEWFAELDGRGVPCEVASNVWRDQWYDDPDAVASGWVAAYDHPVWGRLEQPGRFVDLSLTPARVAGPPPIVGADTRAILLELGHDDASINELIASGVVACTG